MPPGVFHNKAKAVRSYERVFSDVEVYRSLGKTAEQTIRFGEAEIQTRDYQVEAWRAVGDVRADGKDSALVHLATGLGKTTVGVVDSLDFAADFYQQNGRPPKIMFAVHQKEILDQAAERYRQFAPSLSHGYYADGKTDTKNPITFATMQSLYGNLDKIEPQEFDYIIYDEAHHAQAETYSEVVEHFTPAFKLALTATPDRMDSRDIRDLFGEPVYSKPLAEAMVEGYLADVDYHIVFDDAVKRAMEAGFTPDTLNEIRELLKNESRNTEIAEQIKLEMEKIGLAIAKTIVFCQDVNQATEMAALLGGKPYHSAIDEVIREDTLADFRSNGVQVITTRDMFNEGVDIPDARLLVFLRSTSSRTIFEQQLGRGLRRNAGKDTVSVLDFVANIERLTQVKELSDSIAATGGGQNDDNHDGDNGTICITTETRQGLSIHTGHTDFDFDRIMVELLEKIGAIREHLNREVPQSIEEAAILWREQFGDEVPTIKSLDIASKAGLFVSSRTILDLGGMNAFKQALGFEVKSMPENIEEAAILWREQFGDELPKITKIVEASKNGTFVSSPYINKLGGIDSLRRALGFAVRSDVETIEEAAILWREQFGDEVPTKQRIVEASGTGEFVTRRKIAELGGVEALKQALGMRIKITTIEEAAILWREQFGDEVPSAAKIAKASKDQKFITYGALANIGSIDALKEALGLKIKERNVPLPKTVEEAADLWYREFGDEVPTQKKIDAASKEGRFVSSVTIRKLGGTDALKMLLKIYRQ